MTTVCCSLNECLSNKNEECTERRIQFDGAYCSAYVAFDSVAEYKQKFWISCKEAGKPESAPYREERTGKRLELFGMAFFTEYDDRRPDECRLTEAGTGILAGTLSEMTQERADMIKERLKEFPDVMTLPEKEAKDGDWL